MIGVTSSGSSVRACFSPITLNAATDIALVTGAEHQHHQEVLEDIRLNRRLGIERAHHGILS